MPRTKLPIHPRTPKPALTVAIVLRWADEFHTRTGRWPRGDDGPVPGTADENWNAIDAALARGNRGLVGGTTLAKLLLKYRGRPHYHLPPDLTIPQILGWADTHHRRTGMWPGPRDADPIPTAPGGLTWVAVEMGLVRGRRGLPGGSSLANLLATHRGVRNRVAPPDLTEADILRWADAFHARTGRWPKYNDGAIAGTDETWCAIDCALLDGRRGLPGGRTLARFLARHRGVRNKSELPRLTVGKVTAWARAHHARTGRWPSVDAGPIREAPGETWRGVDAALRNGLRGFRGGDSLARLLTRECGKRNLGDLPPLSLARIREWVRDHYSRRGRWPHAKAGPIPGVPGETWSAVDNALSKGRRGLPGGMTLARLVREYRGSAGVAISGSGKRNPSRRAEGEGDG